MTLERTTQPQTLIEKLENYRDTQTDFEATFADAVIDVCIDIIKQHSDWVSADEELPVLEYECGFRSFEPTNFYQIIDNEGCLHNAYFSTNHYANDDRALFTLCELSLYNGKWLVDDEYEVITVDMAKYWMPLPQPPSEVQDDQNCKTMPCSHDDYSDCKQAKLL